MCFENKHGGIDETARVRTEEGGAERRQGARPLIGLREAAGDCGRKADKWRSREGPGSAGITLGNVRCVVIGAGLYVAPSGDMDRRAVLGETLQELSEQLSRQRGAKADARER